MPRVHDLVRIVGVFGICAALAGPASAVPADGAAQPGVAQGISPTAASSDAAASADTAAAAIATAMETGAGSDWLSAYGDSVDRLQELGVEPFLYPTAAPFCLNSTTLGLAPALAGAIPGPWPRFAMDIPGLDLSAVKAGQTMFAFVPFGLDPDSADTSGMHVAWMNADTGKFGLVPMGSLAQVLHGMVPPQVPVVLRPVVEQAITDFFASALPQGGVRAVPVDTGSGTVLAAVFGVVRNGTASCVFLPTVGISAVP
ncbi:hypothetical protein HLB23_20275 [Nocardia uniformis]|uniref:Uncharacterized protein n=1 Tax=Nocardia uniformis TaxID=53432 RepID=A0A849C8F9_9NOCA|nr:hypothetical protein [Nocardia uniformis]NNH72167.1 hypothetical protein [Nocardia uniformis]